MENSKLLTEEELKKLKLQIFYGNIDAMLDTDYSLLFKSEENMQRTRKNKPKKKTSKKA